MSYSHTKLEKLQINHLNQSESHKLSHLARIVTMKISVTSFKLRLLFLIYKFLRQNRYNMNQPRAAFVKLMYSLIAFLLGYSNSVTIFLAGPMWP